MELRMIKRNLYIFFCVVGGIVLAVFSTLSIKEPNTSSNGDDVNIALAKNSSPISNAKSQLNSLSKLSSNQKLLIHINAIEKISFDVLTTASDYNSCQQLTSAISKASLSDKLVQDILIKCRGLRNRYGVSEDKISKWKEVKELLKIKGWQYVMDKVQSGDIPTNLSLQEGEPKHNLHTLFISGDVTDDSAYQFLTKIGVEPSSKDLFLAMVRKNDDFINFYKNAAQFYESDDMLSNSVTQAASSGSLKYMGEFLDLGLPYNDLGNRDPLIIYLSRYANEASAEQLDAFIRQHNISITSEHIAAAKSGNANEEALTTLKQLKRD